MKTHPTCPVSCIPVHPCLSEVSTAFAARVRGCSTSAELLALLIALLLLAGGLGVSRAAVPEFMTYQGFLVNENGAPLATSNPENYPVIFRIYTASTGGTRLWSEQQIVTVDKGSFSVVLGEGAPVPGEARPLLSTVFPGTSAERFMGITVTIGAASVDILPRIQLLPAPYAFLATSANNLVNAAGASVISAGGSRVDVAGDVRITGAITGNGFALTNLNPASVPLLSTNSIPLLNVSKIPVLTADRIPTLTADKIPTLTADKIPVLPAGKITNNLDGDRIFSGNVGIGATAPAAKLQVVGDVKLGSSGQYFAPGGVENLKIIRGVVRSDGLILAGSGFTVVRIQNTTGEYFLRWDTPFASTPPYTFIPVTANVYNDAYDRVVRVASSSETQAQIWINKPSNGAYVDANFTFIAVGPR